MPLTERPFQQRSSNRGSPTVNDPHGRRPASAGPGALGKLLSAGLAALSLSAQAIEEPAYEVIQTMGSVELRQYAPYVVAEVVLPVPAAQAGNEAFPILAGYIFGKNKGARSFAMTAPVTQTSEPLRMPMTAPVTQAAAAGGTRVQFVLPRDVTLDSAPEPLDPRVQLRQVPATRWATIRYSGTWSQANQDEHLLKLQTALQSAAVTTHGEPVLARYNSPFTPWFLRRNELWLSMD